MPLFVKDTKDRTRDIERSIHAYGYAPEHNIFDYRYALDEETENVFVSFENDMGILAKQEGTTWWMLAEPLAPKEERARILCEFVTAVFEERGARSIRFELFEETYKDFICVLQVPYHARRPSSIMTAPIFDVDQFDPTLRGNRYKKIRSSVGQLYRARTVEIQDASHVPQDQLHDLVDRWKKFRTAKDSAFDEYYHRVIDNHFEGFDSARVMTIDGRICALNGGWSIPNTGVFYKALGVHDYSDRALGDATMVEELTWLKAHGYHFGDFGAGDEALTSFKKRFGPAHYYKTYSCTVIKKEV